MRRICGWQTQLQCVLFLFKECSLRVIELAQQQQEISKIVVPIDGSKNSMEAAEYAIKMSQKYGSKVACVHVVNIDQNLQLLGVYRLSYPDPIKKKVEEGRAEAQKWFNEIIRNAEQRKVPIKTDVIDSPMSVIAALVNYAEQEKADLIVIGTRGRSGISKMLLGSVASGVVTYAPCPVLVVK
jgi:nucleotide-binding universal stress UspA family protein